MKNIKFLNFGFFIYFFLSAFHSSSAAGVSCKVHSFLVNNNYQLPYRYDQPEIVNGSSTIKPGDYVIYTFEVINQSNQERIELQEAYMTQLLGSKEPIEIIGVRPQNGNCSINSTDKSVFCSTNYSGAESITHPIEFLVRVTDKPESVPSTSSMFSIKTSEGSTQCASYLWIKEENKPNSINWSTTYAKISSANFYIRIGDKKFYGKEPIRISSDPGTDKTTLESIWFENGVEMRMFMYFQKTSNGEWEMYDLRTYNGNPSGDWIYYKDSLGNRVSSVSGVHNYHDKRIFIPTNGADAEIYCDKCSINAFLKNDLPISELGYSLDFLIGLPPGKVITISNQPLTGYGVNVLLKNNYGEVVKDQSSFKYQWSVNKPEILYLKSSPLDYGNGKCAYDINYPCPQNHVEFSGLKPGKANINLVVTRVSDNAIVAENSFLVQVNPVSPTTVAFKCFNRGESVKPNDTVSCCQGLTLIKPEGDRTDILGLCMQECSSTNDCFIGEVCQKDKYSQRQFCTISTQDNQSVEELRNEIGQLKTEIENQKIQQNILMDMINSIKEFLQRMFKI